MKRRGRPPLPTGLTRSRGDGGVDVDVREGLAEVNLVVRNVELQGGWERDGRGRGIGEVARWSGEKVQANQRRGKQGARRVGGGDEAILRDGG